MTSPFQTTPLALSHRLLGGLLLWAGASKVSNPVVFFGDIMAYRLHGALLFSLALFGVFDLVTAQAVVRGLDIDCGCFNADALQGLHLDAWVSTFNSVGFALGRDRVLTAAIL